MEQDSPVEEVRIAPRLIYGSCLPVTNCNFLHYLASTNPIHIGAGLLEGLLR